MKKTLAKVGKDAICIFAGDINIDLLDFEHEQVLNYMTTFLSYKFLPYISLPTRITHHSATCIDHNKHPLTRLFGNVQCQTFNNDMNNFNWEEIYTPTGDWYSVFIEKVKYFLWYIIPIGANIKGKDKR